VPRPSRSPLSSGAPAKADKRTLSKWSVVTHYSAAYKPDCEPLDHFIKRKGGINACSARFSRCTGRGRATNLQKLSETIMGLTATQRDPNISGPNPERRLT
jgi:hypothetical protein